MYRRYFVLFVFILLVSQAVRAQEITGPYEYPPGVSPLTGLPVDDSARLARRPLNIKITNFPPIVRPQSGLNSADIVWEHLVEGGITRFTAIFQSQAVSHLGPIRSARLVDIPLTHIFSSLFVHSGSSTGTLDRLRQDAVMPRRNFGGGGCPPLCRFPREGLSFEHTLYGDTEGLYTHAEAIGLDVAAPANVSGLAFSSTAPSNGVTVAGVKIAYRHTETGWVYDSGRWLRSQDGEAHFDAITNTQVNTANVVIIEADHLEQPVVYDGYWGTANYAFEVNFVGSGHIYLLRDGQYFEGEWRRENDTAPLLFFDTQGNMLPFKPGTTFFNLVPRWADGYQLTFLLADPLEATVTQDNIVLRVGPGTGYGQKAYAARGDTLALIGRDWRGEWVQALQPNGQTIWVSTSLLDLGADDVLRLPAVRSTYER